jgi:hypothetical protein
MLLLSYIFYICMAHFYFPAEMTKPGHHDLNLPKLIYLVANHFHYVLLLYFRSTEIRAA